MATPYPQMWLHFAHGHCTPPHPRIRLHRGLLQDIARCTMLQMLLVELLVRNLGPNPPDDDRHSLPPLVRANCDMLLVAHTIVQFLENAEAIVRYLGDMGMSPNVRKWAYTTRTKIIVGHCVLEPAQ